MKQLSKVKIRKLCKECGRKFNYSSNASNLNLCSFCRKQWFNSLTEEQRNRVKKNNTKTGKHGSKISQKKKNKELKKSSIKTGLNGWRKMKKQGDGRLFRVIIKIK